MKPRFKLKDEWELDSKSKFVMNTGNSDAYVYHLLSNPNNFFIMLLEDNYENGVYTLRSLYRGEIPGIHKKDYLRFTMAKNQMIIDMKEGK